MSAHTIAPPTYKALRYDTENEASREGYCARPTIKNLQISKKKSQQ